MGNGYGYAVCAAVHIAQLIPRRSSHKLEEDHIFFTVLVCEVNTLRQMTVISIHPGTHYTLHIFFFVRGPCRAASNGGQLRSATPIIYIECPTNARVPII